MAPSKSLKPKDLVVGGVLQTAEALTLGMPFEVWKTYMGTYRNTGTMEAFHVIYSRGGVAAFWKGWQPKAVESFLKGGVLMFSKEAIIRGCQTLGASDVTAGLVGGFGGGVAQVVVVGPCSYLVTASVTGDKSIGMLERITQTYQRSGIAGFYKGGTALMLRQGSNWASRQGLTDLIRERLKSRYEGDPKKVKLSTAEEALAGILGGALSTWNQPFEVMRIEAQAAAVKVRACVLLHDHVEERGGNDIIFALFVAGPAVDERLPDGAGDREGLGRVRAVPRHMAAYGPVRVANAIHGHHSLHTQAIRPLSRR